MDTDSNPGFAPIALITKDKLINILAEAPYPHLKMEVTRKVTSE